MIRDYKYEAQLKAEELAFEEIGQDFYDLSMEDQIRLYNKGLENWAEHMCALADGRINDN